MTLLLYNLVNINLCCVHSTTSLSNKTVALILHQIINLVTSIRRLEYVSFEIGFTQFPQTESELKGFSLCSFI